MKQLGFLEPAPDTAVPHALRSPQGITPPDVPRPNPVAVEKARLNRLAKQMLAYMQARKGQWIPNHELWAPHVGGNKATSQRKRELIEDGWVIEKRHAEGGTWEYKLVGRKEW